MQPLCKGDLDKGNLYLTNTGRRNNKTSCFSWMYLENETNWMSEPRGDPLQFSFNFLIYLFFLLSFLEKKRRIIPRFFIRSKNSSKKSLVKKRKWKEGGGGEEKIYPHPRNIATSTNNKTIEQMEIGDVASYQSIACRG